MAQEPKKELLAEISWQGQRILVDLGSGFSLAIPLQADRPQPAFFAAAPFKATPLSLGEFTGSVGKGGSCNVQVLSWAPHCHGTHTECVGHILPEPVSVNETIDQRPCLARLVTIAVPDDKLIRLGPLQAALADGLKQYHALVIRTLPNSKLKLSRNYDSEPAYPVFDAESMQWLASTKLKHLLIDMPSLDAVNNASLSNHRIWWGLDDEASNQDSSKRSRSLTEMIFVANSKPDGDYWFNLELSPLVSDATPSRPILYSIRT